MSGNKLISHVDIGAQENAYIILQMPLHKSSRTFLLVNTSPHEDCPFIMKSDEQLKLLPDDSEGIMCENVISRYAKRPTKSETMCLADFAPWYDMKAFHKKKQKRSLTNRLPVTVIDHNIDHDPAEPADDERDCSFLILSNDTVMRKCKHKKVICVINYNMKVQKITSENA